MQCQTGSQESLVSLLQQGHLVGLSPGGTYEAQMGDNMYKLMWRARSGFARVVEEVGEVPVIPVFTQNIREAYKAFNHGFTKPFWLWLHDSRKIRGFVPVYGGFPVKLRTFIGKAVTFPKGTTVEEVKAFKQSIFVNYSTFIFLIIFRFVLAAKTPWRLL